MLNNEGDESSSDSEKKEKKKEKRKESKKKTRENTQMAELEAQRWSRRRHLPRLVNVVTENKDIFLRRNETLNREQKDSRSAELVALLYLLFP